MRFSTRIPWGSIFALVATGLVLATIVLARQAGAQQTVVTDYDNYPANSGTQPGCDASGVNGIEYTLNGGVPFFDLANLPPVNEGDELTVSYTDVSDACNTPDAPQPLVLSMKSAAGPTFDPNVNQRLELPYVIDMMGPIGGRMTYSLPALWDDSFDGCHAQLDLIVGYPLEIVGPDGSYYSASLNGSKQMLVQHWNGSYEECVIPTPVTEPEPTTTTTVTETPTTLPVDAAPTTTVASEPTPTTVQDMTNIAAARPAFTAATDQRNLATTGPNWTLWLAVAGGIILVVAACLVLATRRR